MRNLALNVFAYVCAIALLFLLFLVMSYKDILKKYARKKGIKCANNLSNKVFQFKYPSHEKFRADITYLDDPTSDLFTGWILKKFSEDYHNGIRYGWNVIGSDDARNGRCRASIIQERDYDMGWYNEVIDSRNHGWKNDWLENHFSIMAKHYFGEIKDFKGADEVYRLLAIPTGLPIRSKDTVCS
ncbi:MAG: hypothetical protein D0530_01820 [Methylococcales bacterium]|nr:MAG: hypothetical protein D0530_01820 [Methylococcales bacterium]